MENKIFSQGIISAAVRELRPEDCRLSDSAKEKLSAITDKTIQDLAIKELMAITIGTVDE